MELITALTIGLMGSFHCVGMCGPIALALPLTGKNYWQKSFGSILYNIGRVVTYSMFGLLFGLFGKGLALAGLQQTVSIVMGVIMILSLIIPSLFKKIKPLQGIQFSVNNFITRNFSKYIKNPSYSSLFVVGLLNGLLPCGLVYLAVAGAIASSNVYYSIAYMALFGLGTLPMMLFLNLAGKTVSLPIRNTIRKTIPAFVFVLGVLFILRGMNLGIKYISPKIDKSENKVEHCCH